MSCCTLISGIRCFSACVYSTLAKATSLLMRALHVERYARCMDAQRKHHPYVRRDQLQGAAWIPACVRMTTPLRAQHVDAPKYITRHHITPAPGPPEIQPDWYCGLLL
jgi:hypothetical protein